MFFRTSESRVEEMIQEHKRLVGECLSHLEKVVEQYLSGDAGFVETSYALHKAEHTADEVRRLIQVEISTGAFLPFYRTDYIHLVEMIDKVANRAVDFSKALVTERPKFPREFHARLRDLAHAVAKTYEPLAKALEVLMSDTKKTEGFLVQVSEGEQDADSHEWKLLKDIFANGTDRAEQIFLRDTIQRLGSIADAAENAADRVRIIITKQVT